MTNELQNKIVEVLKTLEQKFGLNNTKINQFFENLRLNNKDDFCKTEDEYLSSLKQILEQERIKKQCSIKNRQILRRKKYA